MGTDIQGYKPQIWEPRCHICNSKFRALVDMLAAQGYRPSVIVRYLKEVDEDSAKKTDLAVNRSVSRHIKNHLNYEQDAIRKLVEEKAREAGIFADEAKATLITKGAVVERMIQKGWKQLSDEDSRVPYEFVLKAIEIQETMEKQTASLMVDQLTRQLQAIIQAVKEKAPEQIWSSIIDRAREIHDTPLVELSAVEVELSEQDD